MVKMLECLVICQDFCLSISAFPVHSTPVSYCSSCNVGQHYSSHTVSVTVVHFAMSLTVVPLAMSLTDVPVTPCPSPLFLSHIIRHHYSSNTVSVTIIPLIQCPSPLFLKHSVRHHYSSNTVSVTIIPFT